MDRLWRIKAPGSKHGLLGWNFQGNLYVGRLGSIGFK
jgi:hypothetical protein